MNQRWNGNQERPQGLTEQSAVESKQASDSPEAVQHHSAQSPFPWLNSYRILEDVLNSWHEATSQKRWQQASLAEELRRRQQGAVVGTANQTVAAVPADEKVASATTDQSVKESKALCEHYSTTHLIFTISRVMPAA